MDLPTDQHGNRLQAVRFGTTQSVAYTGTAGTIASGVGRRTKVARIRATTSCFIATGTSPTATTSDTPIVADVIEYIVVNPGDKVSAIRESSSGTLYVTEIS